MTVQWAHLGAGRVLVAGEHGAWVQRPQLGGLALSAPMRDWLHSTPAATRQLLDGAIALAERDAPAAAEPPPMTVARWAWHLVGQWYCAHHSVALLPVLIDRCERAGRADLTAFCRLKLVQERGHDEHALDDLSLLGYDAGLCARGVAPPPPVIAAVGYARECVAGGRAAEFVGYVYTLERLVLRLSPAWFEALDAVLPAGVDAARDLRDHAERLDVAHVEEAVEFIAGLPAADRTAAALGAHHTAAICCQPYRQPTEAQLRRRLAGAAPAPAAGARRASHRQGVAQP